MRLGGSSVEAVSTDRWTGGMELRPAYNVLSMDQQTELDDAVAERRQSEAASAIAVEERRIAEAALADAAEERRRVEAALADAERRITEATHVLLGPA